MLTGSIKGDGLIPSDKYTRSRLNISNLVILGKRSQAISNPFRLLSTNMLMHKKALKTNDSVGAGTSLGRKVLSGKALRRSAPPKFAKIKPKKATSFVHGKICSSQYLEYVDPHNIRGLDYCSLGRSLSPCSQESGRIKNYHSSHHLGSNMELSRMANYVEISRNIEDRVGF